MRSVSISVTEASRNFADCVNRARYQGTTFLLHKNGVAVARIVPEGKLKKEEDLEPVPVEAAADAEAAQPSIRTVDENPMRKPREIW
jgi:antitoxin (DNA-binding transcriptional repressor) of toxin-antitoxin stability system